VVVGPGVVVGGDVVAGSGDVDAAVVEDVVDGDVGGVNICGVVVVVGSVVTVIVVVTVDVPVVVVVALLIIIGRKYNESNSITFVISCFTCSTTLGLLQFVFEQYISSSLIVRLSPSISNVPNISIVVSNGPSSHEAINESAQPNPGSSE